MQKVINLTEQDGSYYNFFYTPGSIGSLASYIEAGWKVVFMKDDPRNRTAVVIIEKIKQAGEV